jgi:hypothetical protein
LTADPNRRFPGGVGEVEFDMLDARTPGTTPALFISADESISGF